MKTRSVTGNGGDDNSPTMKQPAARPEKSEMNREPKEPRKFKKKQPVSDLSATTDFRPQRLTEVCITDNYLIIYHMIMNNERQCIVLIFNRTICLHRIRFFPT